VDLYSINIPLIPKLQSEDGMRVLWTSMWNNSTNFGRLFKQYPAAGQGVPPAGPDAEVSSSNASAHGQAASDSPLIFRFSPDMGPLIKPGPNTLPVGTDAWALDQGHASVTALRAAFAEVNSVEEITPRLDGEVSEDKYLKLKL
jgi:tubulin---tyrosine ligase